MRWRTPLQAAGYVRVTALVIMDLFKIKYFHLLICFIFFQISLIFNIVFYYIGSCPISYSSNVTSITPQFTTPKLFFDFRVFFKDLSCCDAFYNLHHF